jgi:membrane protease YdiL (CAAX protease family)
METGPTQWRVRDFLLAMAGGFAGVVLVAGVALVLGADTESIIVFGALGQFGGHLAALWALALGRGGLSTIGFEIEPSDVLYIFAGIGLQILVPLVFAPLAALVGDGPSEQMVADQIRLLQSTQNRLLMAGVVAVLAPIAEEMMFRGVLLQSLAHRGLTRVSLITAAVFASFHLFGLTGDILASVVLLLPTFLVMGVVLARITWTRQRLGPAIFVHSGFNLLALSVLLLPPDLLEQLSA